MFQLFGEAAKKKGNCKRGGVGGEDVLFESGGVTRAVEAVCGVCAMPCWPHAGFRLLLQIISLLSLHQQADGQRRRRRQKAVVLPGLFGCVRACPLLLLPRLLRRRVGISGCVMPHAGRWESWED